MTVASFRANDVDDTWDVGGGGTSDALDVVTLYGDPGLVGNTFDEVGDGIVDHSFTVSFAAEPCFGVSVFIFVSSRPQPAITSNPDTKKRTATMLLLSPVGQVNDNR